MIRVAIAEDHAIVLAGVCRLLGMSQDIKVVTAARSGEKLLESLDEKPVDLAIIDLSMPGLSGTELIRTLHDKQSSLPILVLTMHNDVEVANRMLAAGASGFLTKDRDPELLLSAIRTCASGGHYVDPDIAAEIIFSRNQRPGEKSLQLSRREQQIYDMIVRGDTLVSIAEQLNISPKTVSTHKFRLMEKLGVESMSELIRYALKNDPTS